MTGVEYVIRQATAIRIDEVMGLLAESTAWLHGKGLDQWQGTDERRRLLVRRDIDRGTVHVVLVQGEVVATITVDDLADTDFWRPSDDVFAALYAHRMAVARRYAGIGLGAALLDWAAREVVRRGRSLLRLDAWSTNTALQRYYENQSFLMVRNDPVPGRGSGALFERIAEIRHGGGPPLVERGRHDVHGHDAYEMA